MPHAGLSIMLYGPAFMYATKGTVHLELRYTSIKLIGECFVHHFARLPIWSE
jgi:hypothetical protein